MSVFSNVEEVHWHKFIWHKHHCLRFSSYAWMVFIEKLKSAVHCYSAGFPFLYDCS
ncbi:hypothetical protein KFK09_010476 [Dendrobium nobile]|uniref:Uncharacterized protein n=1 Tax=Dendrobium nobile TaxID=94219 RepID=A0A8T3BA39_DENNO|nr:hypothetical protein KFK09_010476 [Dendrobium nobile]